MPPGRLPFVTTVRKIISRFPGLKYNGTTVTCIYCNINFVFWSASHCKQHISSRRHIANKTRIIPYWKFLYDFIFMISVCNIPHPVVDMKHFHLFWEKYVPSWRFPTRKQLHYLLPQVKEMLETNIKCELKNKKLWLTVDETIDDKNSSVATVLVRVLNTDGPSVPYLLCSKRLKQAKTEALVQLVKQTVNKFGIKQNQVLMIVTDGTPHKFQAGNLLKLYFFNPIHITCLLHALYLVAENVRSCYPAVDTLIHQTKLVFVKSRKRNCELRAYCPEIPEPPQLMSGKGGTWLEAAFYYNKYFQQIKSVVLKFNSKNCKAIQESQHQFRDPLVEKDLGLINENYSVVLEGIQKLQKSSLSLAEALDIVENVRTTLNSLTDNPGIHAAEKLEEILSVNPDYNKLRSISQCINDLQQPVNDVLPHFKFAITTCIDAERLFSNYISTFSSLRRPLSEATMEGYVMMQVYDESLDMAYPSDGY